MELMTMFDDIKVGDKFEFYNFKDNVSAKFIVSKINTLYGLVRYDDSLDRKHLGNVAYYITYGRGGYKSLWMLERHLNTTVNSAGQHYNWRKLNA